MLPLVLAMLLILVLAAVVCLYAAHPNRRADHPATTSLGTVLGHPLDGAQVSESTDDRAVR